MEGSLNVATYTEAENTGAIGRGIEHVNGDKYIRVKATGDGKPAPNQTTNPPPIKITKGNHAVAFGKGQYPKREGSIAIKARPPTTAPNPSKDIATPLGNPAG